MVWDRLIDIGVDPNMLKAKGYGDSKPVAINNDSFQNRRIEFTVVQ